MLRGKKIVCIIPARKGSKGLPDKNIKELLGKPLIAYTIEHARESRYIDKIIVSTDSEKIADISKKYGAEVPFLRPKKLSNDNSSVIDVLIHAVKHIEKTEKTVFDIVVLLHVTAPLRTSADIDKCIELLINRKTDNVFSVTEAQRNPYFNMVEITKNKKVTLVKKGSFVTRQSAPKVYDMNASIYVWWKKILEHHKKVLLKKSHVYIMPKERSVDIDDNIDFRIAEIFMEENIRTDG